MKSSNDSSDISALTRATVAASSNLQRGIIDCAAQFLIAPTQAPAYHPHRQGHLSAPVDTIFRLDTADAAAGASPLHIQFSIPVYGLR